MKPKDFIVVLTTVKDSEETRKIGKKLVEEKLVACVNYTPVNSIYTWKGKINEESECLLFCKTIKERYKDVEKRIKELHSYECPEIIAVPVVEGSSGYLRWISKNTKGRLGP